MHITIYLPTYRFHFDHPEFEDTINWDVEFITGEFLFKHNLRIVGYAQLEDEHKDLPNVYELAEKLDELQEIKRRAWMAVHQLLQS